MARSRRAGAPAPADALDPLLGVPQDAEYVDPLQIASQGLEEVEDEPVERAPAESGSNAGTPDPIALASVAIDEELAHEEGARAAEDAEGAAAYGEGTPDPLTVAEGQLSP